MPLLNWQTLNPNQVTGTVFNELDDEQVLGVRFFFTCTVQFSLSRKLQFENPFFNPDLLSFLSLPLILSPSGVEHGHV